jgi:hypothetical protein
MRGSFGHDLPTQNAGLVFTGAIDIRLLDSVSRSTNRLWFKKDPHRLLKFDSAQN